MNKLTLIPLLALGLSICSVNKPVSALPGQLPETVTAWINANPTLRPALGDGLSVQKNNSAAQRFSFQASILPPNRIETVSSNMIRSEQFTFFDMINGVTLERLEESLRKIYGVEIYQDYQRSQVVYSYPSPETAELARRQNLPLLEAQEGELRVGERYGYWLEITNTDRGIAYNGQMTVFLKEDLDKLEAQLRDR